jgi:hypothetical protein
MIALSRCCERVGVAPVTAWRFRRRGWLKTVNIAGRVHVTEKRLGNSVGVQKRASSHKNPRVQLAQQEKRRLIVRGKAGAEVELGSTVRPGG